MNQTKKRLSIINLAISITDLETIQLQISKLRLLKTDTKIQEIIAVLQKENYAQAQGLITTYIETPTEEVIQRASQHDAPDISKEDQAIIDEFQLFVTSDKKGSQTEKDIDINDYYVEDLKIPKKSQEADFDTLLNITPEEILPGNIDLDISHSDKDNFFELKEGTEEKEQSLLDTSKIPKDNFFDIEETVPETKEGINEEKDFLTYTPEERASEKSFTEDPLANFEIKKVQQASHFEAIPNISLKLISLKKQYPPVIKTYEKFETVEALLRKISEEGYTEKEIEEMLGYINKLLKKEKYTEATQLLLVCAATESKFAQFMLARELYKGILITKDIDTSFTMMQTLAEDEYPEALCDLGQFYENGIGTTQNSIKAETLYKKASESGIKRAKKHYLRIKKLNKSFLKKIPLP